MSSPKYEVIYFPARGRAELTRQIFAAAGVEFTDTRIGGDKWQALKPETPFGQMPVLKVGKDMIAQSMAVARFAAKETGLNGDGAVNQAKVDMIMETFNDLFNTMAKAHFEKDEAKKAELMKKYKEEVVPTAMAQLEKLAGDGYFVGGKLSAADIMFHNFCDKKEAEVKSPRLSKILANVKANPGIKAWMTKRPKTEF